MTVHHVVLESADETTAPPSQDVLKVVVVGDTVFFEICTLEETFTETHLVSSGGIAVKIQALVDAIGASQANERDIPTKHLFLKGTK